MRTAFVFFTFGLAVGVSLYTFSARADGVADLVKASNVLANACYRQGFGMGSISELVDRMRKDGIKPPLSAIALLSQGAAPGCRLRGAP